MTQLAPARTGRRRPARPAVVGLIALVLLAVVGLLVQLTEPRPPVTGGAVDRSDGAAVATGDGIVDAADGVLPADATAFDDGLPGVGNLDPGLLAALQEAGATAADDGVVLSVNSGWRSPEYQDQLLDDAVAEYGSIEEAARWVATAETSIHVTGGAVDVGADAAAWLSDHGAAYGLCPVYHNEPWHFELRPEAIGHRCPRMYADPTQDPRLQT